MVDTNGLLYNIKKVKTILLFIFTLFMIINISLVLILWCILCGCIFNILSTVGLNIFLVVTIINLIMTYNVFLQLRIQVMIEDLVEEFNFMPIGSKIGTVVKLVASIYIHYPKYSKYIDEEAGVSNGN